MSNDEFLGLIIGVCKHWRLTVIENAVFWTKIDIRYGAPFEFNPAMGYLARSKGALVDVIIEMLEITLQSLNSTNGFTG